MLSDVTRMRIVVKAYHNDDGIQQKRNRVDQRYEHALGIKVLEIRKGTAKKKKDDEMFFITALMSLHTHIISLIKATK